ncbi:hypothetical protein CVV38_01650 [Candidatus Peregrinibacteria bacterium HGW-Peregrinibacteria-1]|jgi:LemA protein|nr:MAG: hypothetical protein CVV38_01650 [Candidatus Peregrinibacteria bacterium HGW-Peregrinibacteria-1]
MEVYNWWILIVSVALVVVVWGVFAYRHLRFWSVRMDDEWELVNQVMRKRQDMVPNLVETMRYCGLENDNLIEELIKLRKVAVLAGEEKKERMVAEADLERKIEAVFALAGSNKGLGTNVNYLVLSKELRDLKQNIEEKTKTYNGMVDQYNANMKTFLWVFWAWVLGYRDKSHI